MKKLAVIDGSGFMFRARYAFPAFYNSEGKNLNVVYGFTRMMMKLIQDEMDYFVIARDSPVKTKRHEQFPDYKGTRKKLEDEFKIQMPLVKTITETLGLPNLAAPGYEADDIIGTIVHAYKNDPDLNIQVYSSDKDLKQLLQPNITIIDPLKNQTTTLQDFELEWWFAPESIVDYLALIGDNADNIKGVAGIWPKKALDLIQIFGTIEEIYENLHLVQGEIKNKLISGKEDAFFSKKLIQLIPVPELDQISLEKYKLNLELENWERILIEERGFTGFKKFFEERKKKKTQPQQLGLF